MKYLPPIKKFWRRDVRFALIMTVSILFLLEAIAFTVERMAFARFSQPLDDPGWQTGFFAAIFDWHEADPDYLWRFRAGLNNPLIQTNSDHLLGPAVNQIKDSTVYRILLLGDSSPVGLGLKSRHEAFGEIARYLLDRRIGGGKTVELINAAVSGYSSEQIRRWLADNGKKYRPNLVVLYCGNNDASISGYYPDHTLLDNQQLAKVRRFLGYSAIYRVLSALLIQREWCAELVPDRLNVRVSPKEFHDNIWAIQNECFELKCPLVILKPPVPYLWPAGLQFKPFRHITGQEGQLFMPDMLVNVLSSNMAYCIDSVVCKSLYDHSDVFTASVYRSAFCDTVPPEEAAALYMEKIMADSQDAMAVNNLGVAMWRAGQYIAADSVLRKARRIYAAQNDLSHPALGAAGSALLYNIGINALYRDGVKFTDMPSSDSAAYIYLDSALQADYFSLRIKRDYWQGIDSFKKFMRIAVIDLPEIFAANGGEKLFVDHCHPTAEGHRLIAAAITDTVIARHWLR